MARRFGLSLFVLVLCVQSIMLARYPSIYFQNEWCNLTSLAVIPVIALLLYIFKYNRPNKTLQKLWQVWALYVALILIPMVAVIWGCLVDKLDTDSFFGPNVLKTTVCAAPILALLLLTTASNSLKDKDLIGRIAGSVALELFCHIEILDMLLARNDAYKTITGSVRITIVSAVCLSLLLTPLEMMKHNQTLYRSSKHLKMVNIIVITVQMFLVNVVLLVIRLVVWLWYEHEASIFITKNVIIIATCILEIFKVCECCGYKSRNSYIRVPTNFEDDDDSYV